MRWLNSLIGKLITLISGSYEVDTWQYKIQSAIQFFIYDFIKIGVLLCFLIFIISYIQSFFPPEKTKKILGKFHGIGANIIGALLGTVTPFCSCSSIPIFIGFTRAGLSPGVTFSFLISSPLVDLGSLMLLVGFFGWPIAIAYVVVGLILAVIGGTLIDKTGLGKNIEEFVYQGSDVDIESPNLTIKDRLSYAKDQMLGTYKKVLPYIVIGVGIGCVIHNVIPQSWIESLLGGDKWYGVLLATILGVPMYADIFGTLPIAEALYAKGAGLGTILSFMMSVTALSLPSLIMLRKAVKPKLLLGFIVIVVLGIILIGYLFNLLGPVFV
ncbi:MAG: permease [Anaeroplasmataceae bacterium]